MNLNKYKKILTSLFFICSQAFSEGWIFPPTTISSVSGNNVSNVQNGTASDGSSIVVWVENNQVRTSYASFGGNWSSPATLSTSNGSAPSIYVDPNGNASAIWIENAMVYACNFTAGGTWSMPIAISSTGAENPIIAGDLSGNAVAIWQRGEAIESSTLLFQGNWSSPDILSNSNSSFPSLWVSDSGYVIAGWMQLVSGIYTVQTCQKKISSVWDTASIVSNPTQNSVYPSVSIGDQNQGVAVWFIYDFDEINYTNVCVEASTQNAQQAWSSPVNFSEINSGYSESSGTESSPGIGDPKNLMIQVAMDNEGSVFVAWTMSLDGSTYNIHSKRKAANVDWTSSTYLLWIPNPCIYSLDISSQSNGKVVVTWMYLNDLNQLTIQSILCSYNSDDYYTYNLPLSADHDNYFPHGSIAAGSGIFYATAAWINNDGMTTSIQAIQGSKDLPQPPKNFKIQEVKTTHAIFTDLSYVLTWDASLTSTTIAYYLYRNGLLIFQDYNKTMMFIDHNRVEGEPVTYAVTAFTSEGLESPPLSLETK